MDGNRSLFILKRYKKMFSRYKDADPVNLEFERIVTDFVTSAISNQRDASD